MLKASSYALPSMHSSMHPSMLPSPHGDRAPQVERFVQALKAARGVDAGSVARHVPSELETSDGTSSDGTSSDGTSSGGTITERIRLAVQRARVDAIARSLAS